MARKSRIEIEGGLYHVITRGNNRQQIFNGDDDYQKFLSLLEVQKGRLPFFVYAYCLMTNHVHLLIERQADSIGRIRNEGKRNNNGEESKNRRPDPSDVSVAAVSGQRSEQRLPGMFRSRQFQ